MVNAGVFLWRKPRLREARVIKEVIFLSVLLFLRTPASSLKNIDCFLPLSLFPYNKMIAFLLFHAFPGEHSKGPCDYRQLCDRFRASLAIPGENYSKTTQRVE